MVSTTTHPGVQASLLLFFRRLNVRPWQARKNSGKKSDKLPACRLTVCLMLAPILKECRRERQLVGLLPQFTLRSQTTTGSLSDFCRCVGPLASDL